MLKLGFSIAINYKVACWKPGKAAENSFHFSSFHLIYSGREAKDSQKGEQNFSPENMDSIGHQSCKGIKKKKLAGFRRLKKTSGLKSFSNSNILV